MARAKSWWSTCLAVGVFVVVVLASTGVLLAREVPTANLKYNEFVTHLDFENYVEKTSDNLWAVEFYAPWCPHCQRFAPTWTKLAATMHEQDSRLRFGVVNCVTQRDLCTLFAIRGYPTLKTLHAGEVVDPFEGKDRGEPAIVKWLTAEMAKFTGEDDLILHNGDPDGSAAEEARKQHGPGAKALNIDGSAVLSKDVVRQVPIRLGDLASTLIFFLDTAPFLGVMKMEGERLKALGAFLGAVSDVVEQKTTRLTLRRLRAAALGFAGDKKDPEAVAGVVAADAASGGGEGGALRSMSTDQWDLARQGLRIVSGMETTAEGGLAPVTLPAHLGEIGGVNDLPWDTCAGTNHQYPCGLWEIFHMLTVRTPGIAAVQVMQVIRKTVANFFACRECQMHFAKGTAHLLDEVDQDPTRSARSVALWLWGMHNRVNVRLAPQWGLKPAEVLYPSVKACRSCRSRTAAGSKYADQDGMWEEDEVYKFLQQVYGYRSAVPNGGDSTASGSSSSSRQSASLRGGKVRTAGRLQKSDIDATQNEVGQDAKIGADFGDAPVGRIVVSSSSKPMDALPVLMAFTSLTFFFLVLIIIVGVLFVWKVGFCGRCSKCCGGTASKKGILPARR